MSEENINRPIWQIDSTHPELVEPLTDALREIVDPEIGLNIIQLGLIRDVRIEDDSALVKMILTTPFCRVASIITYPFLRLYSLFKLYILFTSKIAFPERTIIFTGT